jgi:ABC-type transport system involved in multi-copper enzyme maturation permease subunit
MKIELKTIKNEMLYLFYSKIFLVFFILLLAVLTLNAYGNINALKNAYNHYEGTKQYYLKQGENIDQVLKQKLNVQQEKSPDGTMTMNVDNPLRYEFEGVGKMLNILKPQNLTVSILEMLTFLFGPFIFGLFGVLLATYDFKNKTVKLKSLQQSWSSNILAKQLVSIISVAVLIVLLFLISRLISEFLYSYAKSSIENASQFNIQEQAVWQSNIFIKLLISIFMGSIFSTIGFTFGLIFKNAIAPVIVLAIYNFFVPNLGKYDLKNLVSVAGHRFFEFKSDMFRLFNPIELNSNVAITILIAIFVFLVFTNMVISKKQSKYMV